MTYSMASLEKRSCETQLIMLIEDLARSAVVGKQTDIILLDFSKASDKVKPQELEVRSLYHLYSLKTKSSRCHYVVTL